MKKAIFLLFIFTALTNLVFGQAKEISESEYRKAFRPAYDAIFETSYREKSEEETYENGKLSKKSETVSEFIPPNKYHFITVETIEGISKKSETFIIDRVYYCRKDKGEWSKAEKGCDGGGSGREAGPDSPVSFKYTFEETKIDNVSAKLFQQYMTYVFSEEKLSYSLYKFWINEDGLMLRREREHGSVEPKFVRSRKTEVYEYNPKIKIEAPIK